MLSVIIEVKNPILLLGSNFSNILPYKKSKKPCHLVWLVKGFWFVNRKLEFPISNWNTNKRGKNFKKPTKVLIDSEKQKNSDLLFRATAENLFFSDILKAERKHDSYKQKYFS